MELRNCDWAAFEGKLGGARAIDDAAKNLLALRNKVDTEVKGEPKALVVLTAGETSYPRPDGVHVVSLGHLRN